MDVTKELLEDQGHPVYKSRNELWKDDKNPFAEDEGPEKALVDAARDATKAKQQLIFKIKSQWLSMHGATKDALLALKPKVVSMIRDNTLDQIICRVRDCFDKKSGKAVSPDGTPNHACFKRRKTGEKVMARLAVR